MSDLTDPAFAILTDVKFVIWRVQTLKLVPVPEKERGKFFSGDCYLVFHDSEDGEQIFFWIGSNSSIDEQAVVAIKAVELDDMLGGRPIQHREVMGNESVRFRMLFPEGIITMKGGVDSGLRQVDRSHVVKLFQILGGSAPILREVELDWSSMNHGDTFVLDAGDFIFIWSGISSSGMEKMKAASLAGKLRDKVGEKIVHVTDGEEDRLSQGELKVWCEHLPLERRSQVAEADQSDALAKKIVQEDISLYKCSDMTGNLSIELVKQGNIKKEDLKADDSYILNASTLGIWVWLGRKSNPAERKMAMETGRQFIAENNLSDNTKLTKVNMGGEPEEFKSLVSGWQ